MIRAATLALAALLLAGCGSTPQPRADGVPEFSLTLRSEGEDNRYTYFELARDGELTYGGGRLAAQRTGEPIGKLTPEQRREVWRIVEDHGLRQARSQPADEFTRTRYELTIKTGPLGDTLRTSDEKTRGVKELHDYLFNLQAAERFKLPVMTR